PGYFYSLTATSAIYHLSLHDALPIFHSFPTMTASITDKETLDFLGAPAPFTVHLTAPLKKLDGFFDEGKKILKVYEKIYGAYPRSEEHTSELQSRSELVCRLLLEKKK